LLGIDGKMKWSSGSICKFFLATGIHQKERCKQSITAGDRTLIESEAMWITEDIIENGKVNW
jgi:hypothetical protein